MATCCNLSPLFGELTVVSIAFSQLGAKSLQQASKTFVCQTFVCGRTRACTHRIDPLQTHAHTAWHSTARHARTHAHTHTQTQVSGAAAAAEKLQLAACTSSTDRSTAQAVAVHSVAKAGENNIRPLWRLKDPNTTNDLSASAGLSATLACPAAQYDQCLLC